MRILISVLAIAIMIGGLAVFWANGGIDIQYLVDNGLAVAAQVEQRKLFWAFLLTLLAAAGLLCPLPLGSVIGAGAGFMFGAVWGTGLMLVATSISGSALYVMSNTAKGLWLREHSIRWLSRVEAYSQMSPFLYVFSLRLMPALPFFVVSVLPALAGIRFRAFFLASIVGSLPGLFLVAAAGASLRGLMDLGQHAGDTDLISNQVILLLSAISLFVFCFAIVRNLRRQPAR